MALAGCVHDEEGATPDTSSSVDSPLFSVVGDFGSGDANEKAVAELIAGEHPAWVVSAGDNVYSQGGYQKLVGDYYGSFISAKRFLPVTGNHDYNEGIENYDAFFGTNAGNRFYSKRVSEDVELFVLDSQAALNLRASFDAQQQWLKVATASSNAKYKIVVLHHPPYSSGDEHGSTTAFKWDFASFGVTAVIAGHDHIYERLTVGGVKYVVSGTGGKNLYNCSDRMPGEEKCLDQSFGALFVTEQAGTLHAEFIAADGKVLDSFQLG
jgi:tartrate-resistant acid phosphatase type 5